jgi:hypothetical protein
MTLVAIRQPDSGAGQRDLHDLLREIADRVLHIAGAPP